VGLHARDADDAPCEDPQDTVYGYTQIPWLCDPGGYECTWY